MLTRPLHRFGAVRLLWGCTLLLALGACKPKPVAVEDEDAGAPPPDVCNSLQEALTAPCTLTLGTARLDYLSFAGDKDWFGFKTPANATARTLLHVNGGYAAPNTAVNLSLNVLRGDGQTSIARASDRHGQGAPKPVDIIVPFAEPNTQLALLVSDDPLVASRPNYDARSPYQVTVDVVEDPDPNEPNDTTPTAIPLQNQSGILTGTQAGYLTTTGDVDLFSIDVPAGKKVLYVGVNGPALTPPPPYRLSFTLMDPSGAPISEGVVPNEYLPVQLATARLVQTPGSYTLSIKGYQAQGTTTPPPGDLRLQYTLDVRVMDEDDPNEGSTQNDTLPTATVVSFGGPDSTQTLTGKIGYVPDPDWFEARLPANSQPTVLHYKLVPGTGAGRFPALPGLVDRELRLFKLVQTGGTSADDVTACLNDQSECPKAESASDFLTGLITEQCQGFTPPRCLWSYRAEATKFDGLRNFEGAIPVPPHGNTLSYFLLVQDQENNWADDVDYTLTLDWRSDPDEASRYSGGSEQTTSVSLAEDTSGATFPTPPSGATQVSGKLTYGYGFLRSHDPSLGEGVRSPLDYDAVSSDKDRYEFALPALDPDAGYLDRTWELQWQIEHDSTGKVPYDLALNITFCDGDQSTGSCTPVSAGTLQYTGSNLASWFNQGAPSTDFQPVYDRDESGGKTTVTARAYGCFCFEPRFIKGGKFYVDVVAVDRNSYEPTSYTLRTAYTDYPKTYSTAGGAKSCPPPGPDAGCAFTNQ